MPVYDYDTLAYHAKERPGLQFRSLAHIPMRVVGKAVADSVTKLEQNQTQPEEEAIEFYLLNHAMAEVQKQVAPDQPLGDYLPIVENYHRMLNRLGYRLFNYLTLITLREARHWSNKNAILGLDGPTNLKSWASKIPGGGAEGYLYNNTLDYTFGEWLHVLEQIYFNLPWGGSYGGPKWGAVTKCLSATVRGEASVEMMLDTGYTLAHNTGPIFNKGFHYKHNDGKTAIIRILDCQRAGEIPALVKAKASPHVTHAHTGLLKQIEATDILQARPFVCWDLVEELGSEQSYPHDKAQIASQYGHTDEYKQLVSTLYAKKSEIEKKAALAKAKAEKNKFEVMPGVYVEKARLKRAS